MAITLISTPPAVITREQARQLQNTEDAIIGPIARHTQQNVRVQLTPPAADAILGKGTLWVAESKLYFYSWNTNTGLAIDYPTIMIHAVSRQQLDGTDPCIYTQLDEKLNMPNRTSTQQQTSVSSVSQEYEDDDDDATELKFIPDDIGALDAIFEALSECAALHPDKAFMEEEEDPDYEFYYGNGNGNGDGNNDDNQWFMAAPSDEQELSEVGRASLAYLDSIIDGPTNTNTTTQQSPPPHQHDYDEEMFQDAEEDEK